jgi:hypothetical protein
MKLIIDELDSKTQQKKKFVSISACRLFIRKEKFPSVEMTSASNLLAPNMA